MSIPHPTESAGFWLNVAGGGLLTGETSVAGSKNAFHKLLAGCILVPGKHELRNVPNSQDAAALMRIAETLEASVSFDLPARTMRIDSRRVVSRVVPASQSSKSTGSFLMAGALLGRFRRASVGPPGGDQIGERPVDRHIDAFEQLGASARRRGLEFEIEADKLRGGSVTFEGDTVNGTANAILASLGASNSTTISGASIDPDVIALVRFLRAAGAHVDVSGNTIQVSPISGEPRDVVFDVPSDRNDAATLLVAGALCGSELVIVGAPLDEVTALLKVLREMGAVAEVSGDRIRIGKIERGGKAVRLVSGPYPGFPTDWGPLIQVLMTQVSGESVFIEGIHSARFSHVRELQVLGARARLSTLSDAEASAARVDENRQQKLVIHGPTKLVGSAVEADNLRAAAALMLAGLVATGDTMLRGADHLLRGYDDLVARLKACGAQIDTHGSDPVQPRPG